MYSKVSNTRGERGKISKENISATIGEIATGKKTGRTSDKERILCIPIGMGYSLWQLWHIDEHLRKGFGKKIDFV